MKSSHRANFADLLTEILQDLRAPGEVSVLPGGGGYHHLMYRPSRGTQMARVLVLLPDIGHELRSDDLEIDTYANAELLEFRFSVRRDAI